MKVSQNLSSSSLFHFTSKLEYLQAIIEFGFQARYNVEKMVKKRIAYVAPMICYCDIPLGSVKYHIHRYGGYGIGLSKPYLKDKGVTPLFYIHSKSPQIPITGTNKNIKELQESRLTPYLKPVFGYDPVLKESTRIVIGRKGVNYINEKEWRYIPKKTKVDIIKYRTNQQVIDRKDSINKSSSFTLLKIDDYENIDYIFLEKKEDIKPFFNFLDGLLKRSSFDKELLISKIILKGQLLRDF